MKNLSEGVNSMARGVIAQGAGAVIGTLWPIPDRPTAKFMNYFYNNLKDNEGNVSHALAGAKRSFMNSGQFKHPYFWSGFVLTSANHIYDSNAFR